jgi:hypothetical protein
MLRAATRASYILATPRNSMARANERQGHITAHGCKRKRARLNGLFLRKAHWGRVYWEGGR